MKEGRKKILYITNVNIEGKYLQGVILKIKGQLKAFKDNGFDADLLYAGNNEKMILQTAEGKWKEFKGARQVNSNNFFIKLISHFKVAWLGSINFQYCYDAIVNNRYDAVYLRFYLPGTGLIQFLTRFKQDRPSTKILLEYPTLNVTTEMKKRDWVGRITWFLNSNKVNQLNQQADYIITLTKDKSLFNKPAIFMANGMDMDAINPVPVPLLKNEIILLGVASDCAFYHGFDKVIKGISIYNKKQGYGIRVSFRIISNPLSKNVDYLKNLVKELGVEELVSFELPKSREELKEDYNKVHIGIGTLAMHRINMMDNYSLKHREYAAFGLPFIMSKGDDYFENSPFVFVVERDEEPIDLQQVVDFYRLLQKNYPDYPTDFRNSMENKISWNAQMKNVFAVINTN